MPNPETWRTDYQETKAPGQGDEGNPHFRYRRTEAPGQGDEGNPYYRRQEPNQENCHLSREHVITEEKGDQNLNSCLNEYLDEEDPRPYAWARTRRYCSRRTRRAPGWLSRELKRVVVRTIENEGSQGPYIGDVTKDSRFCHFDYGMAAAEDEYDQTMDPEDTIGEATFIYTNSRASRDQINEAREQGWSLYQHPAEGQKWEEGEDDKPMEPDRQGLPSQNGSEPTR